MRFFVDMPLAVHDTIILPDDVYHHWTKVLRADIGDTATLFNGQGENILPRLTTLIKNQPMCI